MEQNGATTQQGVLRTSEMAVDEEEEGGGRVSVGRHLKQLSSTFPLRRFPVHFTSQVI